MKTSRFPWVSGGVLERRMPGKNGEGTDRMMAYEFLDCRICGLGHLSGKTLRLLVGQSHEVRGTPSSTGTFPIPSRHPSTKPPKTVGKQLVLEKNDGGRKYGESTPRHLQ